VPSFARTWDCPSEEISITAANNQKKLIKNYFSSFSFHLFRTTETIRKNLVFQTFSRLRNCLEKRGGSIRFSLIGFILYNGDFNTLLLS